MLGVVSCIPIRQITLKHLTLAGPCIIIQYKKINQPDATFLQVYYLTFCVAQHVSGASTPIIRSSQTALTASGFILERGGSSAVSHGLAS